jgi:hypothetical protein
VVKLFDLAGEAIAILHDHNIILTLGEQGARKHEQESNHSHAGGYGNRSGSGLGRCGRL